MYSPQEQSDNSLRDAHMEILSTEKSFMFNVQTEIALSHGIIFVTAIVSENTDHFSDIEHRYSKIQHSRRHDRWTAIREITSRK